MIIHFEEKLGKPPMIHWAQEKAQGLTEQNHNDNVLVQVPMGSPGQAFCAGLMHELFKALGVPYVVNTI